MQRSAIRRRFWKLLRPKHLGRVISLKRCARAESDQVELWVVETCGSLAQVAGRDWHRPAGQVIMRGWWLGTLELRIRTTSVTFPVEVSREPRFQSKWALLCAPATFYFHAILMNERALSNIVSEQTASVPQPLNLLRLWFCSAPDYCANSARNQSENYATRE